MAWNCLYQVTPERERELNELLIKRLLAFAQRHDIPVHTEEDHGLPIDMQIEEYCNHWRDILHFHIPEYFLYKRVVSRALGHPKAEGIAYGYVGYHYKD